MLAGLLVGASAKAEAHEGMTGDGRRFSGGGGGEVSADVGTPQYGDYYADPSIKAGTGFGAGPMPENAPQLAQDEVTTPDSVEPASEEIVEAKEERQIMSDEERERFVPQEYFKAIDGLRVVSENSAQNAIEAEGSIREIARALMEAVTLAKPADDGEFVGEAGGTVVEEMPNFSRMSLEDFLTEARPNPSEFAGLVREYDDKDLAEAVRVSHLYARWVRDKARYVLRRFDSVSDVDYHTLRNLNFDVDELLLNIMVKRRVGGNYFTLGNMIELAHRYEPRGEKPENSLGLMFVELNSLTGNPTHFESEGLVYVDSTGSASVYCAPAPPDFARVQVGEVLRDGYRVERGVAIIDLGRLPLYGTFLNMGVVTFGMEGVEWQSKEPKLD